MTDLSMRGSTASSSNYEDDNESLSRKLPKRKSLGFVQFRNGFLSNGLPDKEKICDDEGRSDSLKRSASKRPMSLQTPSPSTFQPPSSLRHASYTMPTAKKPAASTDDLRENGSTRERERKQSTPKPMRLRARDSVTGKGREKERGQGKDSGQEEGEDNRGFIRRLSFVGRHRRTKSGASMSSIQPMERVPSESLAIASPKIQPSDRPPSLPPLPPFREIRMPCPPSPPSSSASSLLPPIELQPPSPSRNFDITIGNDTNDTNRAKLLHSSPTSPSSSGYAFTSTPASVPVSSPPFTHHVKSIESAKGPQTSKIAPSGYTASLGRSTISPKNSSLTDSAHRRNSLNDLKSDLKIPARISQAQQGLKRDLGMVRDFAVYIDRAYP
jgi:serine/arginine repetitive matrix protein 2